MSKSEVRGLYDDKRKLEFLKQLSVSSHVAKSATLAGVPVSTAYYWRDRDPDFRDQWMKALAEGYELLEMEMLDRARNGSPRDIFYRGECVATVREYDDSMAFRLLIVHKEMVARTRAVRREMQDGPSEIRLQLDQRLKDMHRRLLNSSAHPSNDEAESKETSGGNIH